MFESIFSQLKVLWLWV